MRARSGLCACGASLLLAAACSGSGVTPRGVAGSTGASGDGGGNAGSGGSSGSGSIGVGTLAETCPSSAVGRPQLRRLTSSELENTLDDIFPQVKGQWSMSLPEVKSPLGFNNDPALLTVGTQVAEKLLDTAESVGTALVADAVLSQILPCASSAPDRSCAQTFLGTYGRRLFRRPLSATESARYLSYFDTQLAATNFKSALRWMITGLIQSPNAIYRREIGASQGGDNQLSQYEIATELAYTFTGTTPSEALLAQADSGQLQTPEQLMAVAGTLLAAPAGQGVLDQFFRSWLGFDQLPATLPNVSAFAAVEPDMLRETQAFIQDVLASGGGAKQLLTATYTTPSQALAQFYGFPSPASDYAKIERPAGRGVGVLAQGSLIAAHSHETASSPTLRGLLVYERFLCGVRPQVPPNVPTLVPPSPGVKTTRQRYEEQHMAAGDNCINCHRLFDPIGFGFEHFDEAGRYRDQDSGLPIDSSGTLLDGGQPAFTFTGLDDLATQLAGLDKVGACASGYVDAFAFANPVSCLGETRRREFIDGTLGFRDYFVSLAGEPSFTRRR